MFLAALYLVLGLLGLLGAVNALRSPASNRSPAVRPHWLPVMLLTEGVPIRIAYRVALTLAAWWLGVFDTTVGTVALAVHGLVVILHLVIWANSFRTGGVTRRALADIGVTHDTKRSIEWSRALLAYPYPLRPGIAHVTDIAYAPGNHLDVYRADGHDGRPSPTLIQIHGGGWHGGNRTQQAQPLMQRAARAGWVVFTVSYPLTPEATWPGNLITLKRAIAWAKSEGRRYGADPDRIVLTGGSAGAHLVAHLALSANDPQYQPGFEESDTSVGAAVPFYGIYDLLNRNGTRDPWPFIERELMKVPPTSTAVWQAASPLDLAHAGAPPFFVIHGAKDSLVPAAESRIFVEALRNAGVRTAYAEVPGATHAFDVPDSVRTHLVTAAVLSFGGDVVGHPGRSADESTQRADNG